MQRQNEGFDRHIDFYQILVLFETLRSFDILDFGCSSRRRSFRQFGWGRKREIESLLEVVEVGFCG